MKCGACSPAMLMPALCPSCLFLGGPASSVEGTRFDGALSPGLSGAEGRVGSELTARGLCCLREWVRQAGERVGQALVLPDFCKRL